MISIAPCRLDLSIVTETEFDKLTISFFCYCPSGTSCLYANFSLVSGELCRWLLTVVSMLPLLYS